jgi:hypothetical protein
MASNQQDHYNRVEEDGQNVLLESFEMEPPVLGVHEFRNEYEEFLIINGRNKHELTPGYACASLTEMKKHPIAQITQTMTMNQTSINKESGGE